MDSNELTSPTEHKQETPRLPDSPDQPPPRVWLQWYGDGDPEIEVGSVSEGDVTWCRDRIFKGDIPYVPEARVDAVWEKAIAIVAKTQHRFGRYILPELEAARDESEK